MVPIRYFIILTLQFVSCLTLTGALLVVFAFNYSYLGGNHQDRAEMDASIAQVFHPTTDSIRIDR
ncbi:MAG: hypothetical protein AAB250_08085 [Bdellovibrionota bacterium]